MNSQFNEEEVLLIEAFCSNEKLYEAVRKGILAGLYTHGVVKAGYEHDPLQNAALRLANIATENPISDEQLGENIRGIWNGLNALEQGFKGLQDIKSKKAEDNSEAVNEAV